MKLQWLSVLGVVLISISEDMLTHTRTYTAACVLVSIVSVTKVLETNNFK